MLDPQTFARMRIRPARNIASGEDSRRAGLQPFVHDHAAVDFETGALCEPDACTHTDANDDKVSRENCAPFEPDVFRLNCACGLPQVKNDAMLFVDCTNQVAIFAAEHTFERPLLGSHHMDLDLTRPQCGRDFKANETRTNDDGTPLLFRRCNDGARVRKRAQDMDMR